MSAATTPHPVTEAPGNSPDVPGREGLSQLAARILDQLSISAWLPAAALVCLLLMIANLHRESGDLGAAIANIGEIEFPSVLLLVGAVIVATTLTQAFEFEAIRLMEGYWGPGRARLSLANLRSRRHLGKRNKLRRRRDELARRAFVFARDAMICEGIQREVVDIIEDRRAKRSVSQASPDHLQMAGMLDWLDYAPPADRRQLDALIAALRYYPRADDKVLPTRLGNTLRAYEERVHDQGVGPLESFVQGIFHELPVTLQREHDQFRSRLDLYCSLTIVVVVSGAIGIGVLSGEGTTILVITAGLSLALTWLCYRAAIASVRGYGSVLETIAKLGINSP